MMMELNEALDEATGMVRGSRWGTQEWRDDVADTIRAFHTRISEPGSNATDERTEIGCKDAAMWKVEATNWRTEAEAAKEHLTECTEQRDVAWKRIDQLIAERGESVSQGPSIVEYLVAAFDETPASVSQEVDHLAEAKRLMLEVGEPDPLYEHDVAQSHALISIATSLATLAGCVSTIDTSAPHFRTQPHG
jgi:hypothetical protein